MRANGRLILLPGLGADSRLLAPQREAFPDLKVPAWIEPWLRPAIAHAFGCVRAEETNLLLEMASALPPAFLHWGLRAILSWRPGTPLAVPVHHIHGDRDRLIPRRLVRPDRVIAGAGHLLNVTHAGAVNAFLRERLVSGPGGR